MPEQPSGLAAPADEAAAATPAASAADTAPDAAPKQAAATLGPAAVRERGIEFRPLRIRRLAFKIVFVVVSLLLLEVVGNALTAFDPLGPGIYVALAMDLGWWIVVFRTFRGRGESSASRPWWKATATPASSGGLAVLLAFTGVVQAAYVASLLPPGWFHPALLLGNLMQVALVVYLMLSFSLQRRARRERVRRAGR